MDFYKIVERSLKKDSIEIFPDFRVVRSQDLMIRGGSFYAIWDEEKGLWSTDEYMVKKIVDDDLRRYYQEKVKNYDCHVSVKYMGSFSSYSWVQFRKYSTSLPDNYHELDERITFKNTKVTKTDYVSKSLDYALEPGDYSSYDEIIGTLYNPEERAKIEWAIGAVIAGDAKDIQKFLVLYGEAGAGKSTILNIIQKLFEGYYTTFEAKALTSNNNTFSTEAFKSNPLVAIQHDGDLSRIEDNTKLNSIVSHEEMPMNVKYKSTYTSAIKSFLFMATNRPVKITDAKSGIIRRLIDVRPSGNKIPPKRYHALMGQINFELGAIAQHCLDVYRSMGKNYYSEYRPIEMILQTDVFYNFVEANFNAFKEQNGISLSQAYDMYKAYCDEALVDFKLPRHKFREELKNYFEKFYDITRVGNKQIRSYYMNFLTSKFTSIQLPKPEEHACSLVLDQDESILDEMLAECPAQYAIEGDIPQYKWINVTTKLKDIDTSKVHYVQVPENHIVIDFDIKDSDGNKSSLLNLEAASEWPATYAEFSKGGSGVHLHYIYDGDPKQLDRLYAENIEIKVYTGKSSLRRRLSKCNNIPVATISSGLPLKGDKMVNFTAVKNEKALRTLIQKNLQKQIHPGTKPSIDFINKILDDAYNSGVHYDLTDLKNKVFTFASLSSNHSDYCTKLVMRMHFISKDLENNNEYIPADVEESRYSDDRLVFFDVEVFPNLFLINWKFEKTDRCYRMINPTSQEVENLFKYKLVGFNCRRYDNHILYARYLGYNNQQLFEVSQKIINKVPSAFFREAYEISYTDVYDFSSKKQSLKKFEIELGIHHQELGLPWDQPVDESLWPKVAEYCDNDVFATEAVFNARKADYIAREILAELTGLSVNSTNQKLAAAFIFGNDPNPQSKFVYTDLSEMFPGYKYNMGVSTYRGEEVGEGGLVRAKPGVYWNVALLDIASMHPSSIEALNLFGPYTERYSQIKQARIYIKHKQFKEAGNMFDGMLKKYLVDTDAAKALAYALKIIINIVYGLTAAHFNNKFKDPRNVDNIVAKRGALFMVDLMNAVSEKGYTVAHIKTDSIKIPDATPEIIKFVMDFGKKYGYTFEHEATYDRMCLVNDAVYIAKFATKEKCEEMYGYSPGENSEMGGTWTATGAQFAQSYVFKTLFSGESLTFDDYCETKEVKSAMYLDMNETLGEDDHDYYFVGKVGQFTPIKPGAGGGKLVRLQDDKYYSVTGAKDYRWLESETVKNIGKESDIDMKYYEDLTNASIKDIEKYCEFNKFINGPSLALPIQSIEEIRDRLPWEAPCGERKYPTCFECPNYESCKIKEM